MFLQVLKILIWNFVSKKLTNKFQPFFSILCFVLPIDSVPWTIVMNTFICVMTSTDVLTFATDQDGLDV